MGLLALAAGLAFEVSRADLGADLGISAPWHQALFRISTLVDALIGLSIAFTASLVAPTWRLRLGAPLPGVLVNGMAILWFALSR